MRRVRDGGRGIGPFQLSLDIFEEVNEKRFGAKRHEYRTSTEVYRFEYQARHAH
jgi:hypothetical protein